jgi:hypothetical protein
MQVCAWRVLDKSNPNTPYPCPPSPAEDAIFYCNRTFGLRKKLTTRPNIAVCEDYVLIPQRKAANGLGLSDDPDAGVVPLYGV